MAKHGYGKRLSVLSEEALLQLAGTEDSLKEVEEAVVEMKKTIPTCDKAELGSLKTELSQLESHAQRIEQQGVDDVYTGELQSGKQMAKNQKKEMLKRLETLFSEFESLFQTIKKREAGG